MENCVLFRALCPHRVPDEQAEKSAEKANRAFNQRPG